METHFREVFPSRFFEGINLESYSDGYIRLLKYKSFPWKVRMVRAERTLNIFMRHETFSRIESKNVGL